MTDTFEEFCRGADAKQKAKTRRCLYDVLGVPREATAAEIKKAFRKLVMECHPDRYPGDKARIVWLRQYEINMPRRK